MYIFTLIIHFLDSATLEQVLNLSNINLPTVFFPEITWGIHDPLQYQIYFMIR